MIDLFSGLEEKKSSLLHHPLYSLLKKEDSLRLFMETHVFCVWDFQSLLKSLQMHFSCFSMPWLPSSDPEARRLINEIVLCEESDEHPRGGYASHFEIYVDAMREAGCDCQLIDTFLQDLAQSSEGFLQRSYLPPAIKAFLQTTFSLIETGKIHEIAAFFTYGREDLIPDMFESFLADCYKENPQSWDLFHQYMNRHIEVDGDEHGPAARRLLERLCDNDETKWQEAVDAAELALDARLALWDSLAKQLSVG